MKITIGHHGASENIVKIDNGKSVTYLFNDNTLCYSGDNTETYAFWDKNFTPDDVQPDLQTHVIEKLVRDNNFWKKKYDQLSVSYGSANKTHKATVFDRDELAKRVTSLITSKTGLLEDIVQQDKKHRNYKVEVMDVLLPLLKKLK